MNTTTEPTAAGEWAYHPEFEGGTWFHAAIECMAYADGGRCCYCGAAQPGAPGEGDDMSIVNVPAYTASCYGARRLGDGAAVRGPLSGGRCPGS